MTQKILLTTIIFGLLGHIVAWPNVERRKAEANQGQQDFLAAIELQTRTSRLPANELTYTRANGQPISQPTTAQRVGDRGAIVVFPFFFFLIPTFRVVALHTGQNKVSDDHRVVTWLEKIGSGPLFLQDVHLIEHLAHFARERIPERVVHAKGGKWTVFSLHRSTLDERSYSTSLLNFCSAGAHGTFTVTTDFAKKYTMMDVLSEGVWREIWYHEHV